MTTWADHVHQQAHLIIDQLVDLKKRLPEANKETFSNYYRMLEDLFEKDLRLAQLRDNSDLLLRAEGEAFDHDPRVQLVSSIFSNVTTQVSDLTRSILGVRATQKIRSNAIDIALSGIAKGSLYFGLKAPSPDNKAPLLGEDDTLFDSTKRALKIIDEVAHTVEHEDERVSLEEVSEVISDPRVRDAALVAVQRISPSGRRGVSIISVSSANTAPAELTPLVRKAIRASLEKPVLHGEVIEFLGQVREIDLDARRFELRGIADHQVRDLRCAYRNVPGVNPRALLGSTVRARGLVDRAPDEVPRLMSVLQIEIVRPAPDVLD